MSPLEMEKARDRVHNLRARLSDTNSLLATIAKRQSAQDNETRNSMNVAMRAIHAVIADLETVCSDHLDGSLEHTIQVNAANRAKSEVASGEFDSQG